MSCTKIHRLENNCVHPMISIMVLGFIKVLAWNQIQSTGSVPLQVIIVIGIFLIVVIEEVIQSLNSIEVKQCKDCVISLMLSMLMYLSLIIDRLDYSWQPNECMVLPFEPRKFSQHLSQNNLLLVGDSITQLMFESMWCLLGQDLTAQNKDTGISGGDETMWASQLVHRDLTYIENPAAISVAYIRSDYLVKLDDFSLIKPNEGEGYQIGVGSNFPWVHAIPRFKYIMINTVSAKDREHMGTELLNVITL